jgi:hypothetical protein
MRLLVRLLGAVLVVLALAFAPCVWTEPLRGHDISKHVHFVVLISAFFLGVVLFFRKPSNSN